MIAIFILLSIVVVGFMLAINFYPPIRDKWKKWSVVLEGFAATGLYWFGQVSDALKEAQSQGYIPSQWLGYLPYIFLGYLLVKQVQMAASDKKATAK